MEVGARLVIVSAGYCGLRAVPGAAPGGCWRDELVDIGNGAHAGAGGDEDETSVFWRMM